jgi:glycosyltransferase involved in cell wall biosynthesis
LHRDVSTRTPGQLSNMRIGIIAPPFIPVPPITYGGTELFIAHLAEGLHHRGHRVTVYANGDSHVTCELKWRYRHGEWPIRDGTAGQLKNADHSSWAMRDATASVDVVHLNDITGLPFTRFVDVPAVLTLHHPHEPVLTDMYVKYPDVEYVAISAAQARHEPMPRTSVVYHGLRLSDYTFRKRKDGYLAFLGRVAPCKGAHLAIEVAKRAGLPLKIAGEIQPIFQDYWDRQVKPHVDGDRIQYVGEADRARKNELLAGARALLFPIQWDEPFGLVMIEAMACGTPVLAFAGGSVVEIVQDGTSGWICGSVADMAARATSLSIPPESCRAWAAEHFTRERMVDGYIDLYERAVARASGAEDGAVSAVLENA